MSHLSSLCSRQRFQAHALTLAARPNASSALPRLCIPAHCALYIRAHACPIHLSRTCLAHSRRRHHTWSCDIHAGATRQLPTWQHHGSIVSRIRVAHRNPRLGGRSHATALHRLGTYSVALLSHSYNSLSMTASPIRTTHTHSRRSWAQGSTTTWGHRGDGL